MPYIRTCIKSTDKRFVHLCTQQKEDWSKIIPKFSKQLDFPFEKGSSRDIQNFALVTITDVN